MATVTPQEAREAVASIFLSYMGRAPEYEAMAYYANVYNGFLAEQEDSDVGVENAFKALSTDIYLSATANGELPLIGGAFSAEDYVNWIYNNVLGRDADDDGLAYWTAQLESGGIQAPELVAIVLEAAQGDDRDAAYVNNRTQVAVEYAKWENSNPAKFAENPALSGEIMEGVNEDPATVDAALLQLAGGDGSTDTTLTVGVDSLVGTDGDDVFTGPLAQNGLGAVTNTFESGDSIDGQGGYDILHADLTTVVSGTIPVGPAISSVTDNVEEIHLRAQFSNLDVLGNFTTIDAEHNHGVEQWWSDNSRSTIVIEDIRTRPQDTAFGMRQTDTALGADPLFGGPDFIALFDPAQLSGTIDLSDSSLTLTLINNDDPASELADFPVTGVAFNLDGEQYIVASDDMGAAATYADFVTALNAALAEQEGLEGVTAELNGDNTITITDPNGGTFVAVGYTWVDGIVPADGNLVWSQVVGAPVEEDIPITTTLYVDDVGRTDMGGAFIVGSMGTGGVEQFDLLVQRSSWLNWLSSTNNTLEIVNVAHDEGYDGDLTIGWHSRENDTDEYNIWTTTDDRVWDGMEDVRVFDASGFTGELKIGAELTFDSIDKYLADATEPVQFSYLLGDGGSNLTLWVDDDLSDDPDFLLEVVGGLGDDRLNLGGAATKTGISVDGGEGYNTIELWSSTGDTPANAFASFENVQKAVIAGDDNTTQDFVAGNMLGLEEIVIANHDYVDTTLINLDESLDTITLSGKNQTLGSGNNNNDQELDDISIVNAAAAEMTVIMDNTARLDGEFYVDSLEVSGATSAVRTLNIESSGQRNTTNWLDFLNAAQITQLNFEGTQDLYTYVDVIGKSPTNAPVAFNIDGSALTGDLMLDVLGANVNASNAGGHNVVLTGTAGANDEVGLIGSLNVTSATTVTGFETVSFWDADGEVNVQNFTGVEVYHIGDLNGAFELNNLVGNEDIRINTDANLAEGQDITFLAASRSASNTLSLDFVDDDPTSPEAANVYGEFFIQDYRTIEMNLGGRAADAESYTFDLNLLDDEGRDDTDGAYDITTVFARTLTVTGGNTNNAGVGSDSVDLGVLTDVLTTIDFSGYAGEVTLELVTSDAAVLDRNTTIQVNNQDLDYTETLAGGLDSHITSFAFTADAAQFGVVWAIDGFDGFNEAGVDLTNLSILDLSGLGVGGLADISIQSGDVYWASLSATQQAAYEAAEATAINDAANLVITSNDDLDFTIVLIGEVAADITNENFMFA